MKLIDGLELERRPGKVIHVYKFHGCLWEFTTAGPLGKTYLNKREEPVSILIAAQNAWAAHTYLHTHIPSMLPDKISHIGDVWLAPEMNDQWTPPEYACEGMDSEEEDEDGEDDEEEVEPTRKVLLSSR